jgi:hypothetical protein
MNWDQSYSFADPLSVRSGSSQSSQRMNGSLAYNLESCENRRTAALELLIRPEAEKRRVE